MTTPDPTTTTRIVADWNAAHPIGTPVHYWRGVRGGEPSGTGPTRSEAWVLGGHSPVVLIEGTSGSIALTHVEIAPSDAPYRPASVPFAPAPVVVPSSEFPALAEPDRAEIAANRLAQAYRAYKLSDPSLPWAIQFYLADMPQVLAQLQATTASLRAAREELMSARAERVELIRERDSAKREADEWWKRSEKQVDTIADLRHIVESAQKAAIAVVYQDRDRTGSGRMGYLNDDDLKPLLAALHVPWPDPADAEEGADRAA